MSVRTFFENCHALGIVFLALIFEREKLEALLADDPVCWENYCE